MINVTAELGSAILLHAEFAYPAECCGLVIQEGEEQVYVPCRNMAEGPRAEDSFVLSPQDWAAAEDRGDVLAVVHSHPNASANLTDADRVMMERTGLPWLVIGFPSGVIVQEQPCGQRLELVGRVFHHGVVDCWSLVRDYYWERLCIDLPDYERADEWWAKGPNGEPGQDLYRMNLDNAGFVRVGDGRMPAEPHDLALMCILADQPNHAAVFDAQRPGQILHHLYRRLSGHDIWGGYWLDHCDGIWRHRSFIEKG